MPRLALAASAVLAPGLVLLLAGHGAGWGLLAEGAAILALVASLALVAAATGAPLPFAPAIAALALALGGAAGGGILPALAVSAAGAGLGLALGVILARLGERDRAALVLLALALAEALPRPQLFRPAPVEGLAVALLLTFAMLAIAARCRADRARPDASGGCLRLAAAAGLAAGAAGALYPQAVLGGVTPATPAVAALALLAAAAAARSRLDVMLLGGFLLLELPVLLQLAVPRLELRSLLAVLALAAIAARAAWRARTGLER